MDLESRKHPNLTTKEEMHVITIMASRELALKLDLAYVLVKLLPLDNILPGWTGFNTMLCENNIAVVSTIGYLPVVDASSTEYSRIN